MYYIDYVGILKVCNTSLHLKVLALSCSYHKGLVYPVARRMAEGR